MLKISFVIPCYKSELTIVDVISEIIAKVSEKVEYDFEIVAVNDCSPDNVLIVLEKLANSNSKVKVIDLAKNKGKHAAMMAGFSMVTGDIIVNLDDDGQCPLEKLWDLISPLNNGYDVSIASYGVKKQSPFKNFGSKMNSLMASILIEKPKKLQITNFSAVKPFVIKEMILYENPYPYIDGLFLRTTSKIINVPMEERERTAGTGNYTFRKSLSLWLNGFTAFSIRPLRIATVVGCVCALVGFLFGSYTIIHKIINPATPAGYSSMMAALLFIGGMIMLMLGLIGEYIGRVYISINNSPQYVIRKTINVDYESIRKK